MLEHRRRQQVLWIALVAGVTLLAGSCETDDGSPGTPGAPGPRGPGTTSEAGSLSVAITEVSEGPPFSVLLTAVNEDNIRFTGLDAANVRFTMAKLVPGADGNPSTWQSYINRTETKGAGEWGAGGSAVQATTDSNGTFVNNLDGTYWYTFGTDPTEVTAPLEVTWEPALTHRIGVQVSGEGVPVANAVHDWVPDGGDLPLRREIAQTASCNECHTNLAVHGGGRTEVQYCVTCHNPGSTDANSGNTVDMTTMIHKIHRGRNLPSVVAGGTYDIWGYRDERHAFGEIAYPQDIRNCAKCHEESDATPQGGHWNSAPSAQACGACHDDVDFETGANHGPSNAAASNAECTICHRDGGQAGSVAQSHARPAKDALARYKFNILTVTDTAPGQFPVVRYSVTDPSNGDAAYNVLTDARIPSLSLLVGWDTSDYHNAGNTALSSTTQPANPISLNARGASSGNNAAPTDNGDGSFTVTSLRPVPSNVTGSGVVAMTGRAAEDLNGDGDAADTDDRIYVKNVVKYFPITNGTAVGRRTVVDIARCNQCHDQLALHGGSRTDEPQMCVICHNANNTDINQRKANAGNASNVWPAPDGKDEESIDFKTLIHGLHAADLREAPLVVYGNNQTTYSYDTDTVHFPGDLSKCTICHTANSYKLPLFGSVLGTTVDTATSRPDPADDLNVTPAAAVCSSCHDSVLAREHMEQNGASFAALQSQIGGNGYFETCSLCHGDGRVADVVTVHGLD